MCREPTTTSRLRTVSWERRSWGWRTRRAEVGLEDTACWPGPPRMVSRTLRGRQPNISLWEISQLNERPGIGDHWNMKCWAAEQGRGWGAGGGSEQWRWDWDKEVESWEVRNLIAHYYLIWLQELDTGSGELWQCRQRGNYLGRCAGRSHCYPQAEQCPGCPG